MLVEIGNHAPLHKVNELVVPLRGPVVTYFSVPDSIAEDGTPHYDVQADADHQELALHLAQNPGATTHLPGHEAFLSVVRSWATHSEAPPRWVWSDHEDLEDVLSRFFGCPSGAPDYKEDLYFTYAGPPGVVPLSGSPLLSNTDAGRDIRWRQQFANPSTTPAVGTSTGTSATTMTDSGATWGTTQFVGCMVQCGTRIANIISHTGTVLTIDRWYDVTAMGGAAGSTPAATTAYIIFPWTMGAQFMGLSTDTGAVVNGDTTLPSEITTASGGLIRKICTISHSAGASSGTLAAVFTANGSDSLPAVVGKAGISPSILSSVKNVFQTLVSPTATLSATGDQLTPTDTVSI